MKNLELYVFRIRGYWISNFFTENDLKIRKSLLKEHEFAVMKVESQTDIVLTINNNRHIGWGEVYLVFDNLLLAKKYCKEAKMPGIELSISDCNYTFIETY